MPTILALLVSNVLNAPPLARADLVYVPRTFDAAQARVVVALHGCLQSAEAMALGTGWNVLAERHNLVIIYPQVPSGTHGQDCWQYWLPENQRRGTGELARVHREIDDWKHVLGVSEAPVLVTGLSSGAALGAALLACYPDDYQAGALASGPGYALAANEKDALKVQAGGPGASVVKERPCDPRRFPGALMIMQGTRDGIVHPGHARALLDDFLPPGTETQTSAKTNGHGFVRTDRRVDGRLRGRLVMVKGLAHAWSGCDVNLRRPAPPRRWSLKSLATRVMNFGEPATVEVPFFSHEGPNATQMAYDFFAEAGTTAAL